jgi:hypothetical protein
MYNSLNLRFGHNNWQGKQYVGHENIVPVESSKKSPLLIKKEDALQSAIRIGKIIISRDSSRLSQA